MAVRLTNPKNNKVIRDEAIIRFNVIVPHEYNNQSDSYSIVRDGITLRVYIQECAEDGSTDTEVRNLTAGIDQMPIQVRNALRDAYEAIETWAQMSGQLGEGSTEQIDVSPPTPTPSVTVTPE